MLSIGGTLGLRVFMKQSGLLTKELKKKFEARGLSVEIKTEGAVEEEVVRLFNILTREVNRFMREEVMQRRSEEVYKISKLRQ